MLFGARIQILIDDTWVDVSAADPIPVLHEGEPVLYEGTPVTFGWTAERLRSQQLQIRRGRADESSRTQPSTVSFTLDNHDGALTPNNPVSPFYGSWRRGTPVRILAPDHDDPSSSSASLLVLGDGGAYTADDPSLDITADLELIVDTAVFEPTTVLASKYRASGDQRSWALGVNSAGHLQMWWSTDGTIANRVVAATTDPIPLGERRAWRVQLLTDDGAGGHQVTFHSAPTADGPWTLVEVVAGSGTTSVHAGTAPLEVARSWIFNGYTVLSGRVHAFRLLDGIGGTPVADLDFAGQGDGVVSIVDGAGLTWTVESPARVQGGDRNPGVRFMGQVAEITQEWPHGDLEHGDHPGESLVRVTAAGVLRRMGQNSQSIRSALTAAIPEYEPVAYWPLEDEPGATHASSPIGSQPAQIVGAEFGRNDTLPGSLALPTATALGRITGQVTVPSTSGTWMVTHVYHATGPTDPGTFVLDVHTTGTVRRWLLEIAPASNWLRGFNAAGTEVVTSGVGLSSDVFYGWQWLRIEATTVSGQIHWSVSFHNVGGTTGGWSGTVAGTAGRVTTATVHTVQGWSYGHLAVFDRSISPNLFPSDGFAGEPATTRLLRVADEADLSMLIDTRGDASPLGPQGAGSALDEITRAVQVDGGVLSEQRTRIGLAYRTRGTLYNQTPALVLDAAVSEIANPFTAVEDDQRYRNDITVTRQGGAAHREHLPTSDTFAETVQLSLASDTQVADQAGWRLHLGSWEGLRYPAVTVDLAVAPQLLPDVLDVREGDVIRVENLPSQHPTGTVDLLVEGITETLSPHGWTFEFTCSPGDLWQVGVWEDDVLGRADTAGCVLDADVDADETTWLLDTTDGPEWITTSSHPTEFPLDLMAAGERVTVTGITGTSPQTATVVRAVNGVRKPHPAGTPVSLADPLLLAL